MTAFLSFCAAPRAPLPPPHTPPPRVIAVSESRITLRATAYGELHALLALAARDALPEGAIHEAEGRLAPAVAAYRRSLEHDDGGVIVRDTLRRLGGCSDDRCASAAVSGEGFGHAYDRALGPFVSAGGSWDARASIGFAGIEVAHTVLDAPSAEPIVDRAARELGVRWPDRPVPVDVVGDAPIPGRETLVAPALAVHGPCFERERASVRTRDRLADARLLDCILVQAILGLDRATFPLAAALEQALGATHGERALDLVVVHAVAATVKGWEPRHASVYRRAASTVAPARLAWLAKEWPAGGLPDEAAARKLAAELAKISEPER